MPGSKQAGLSTPLGISLLLWNNTLEQNTEQKFCMGFPYKTQEGYAAFRSWAADKPGCNTMPMASTPSWAVPGVTCSLPSRGFFLTLHCLRAVCSHLVVPKALCSLKCFDLGFFLILFFDLSEHPSSGGQQSQAVRAVLLSAHFLFTGVQPLCIFCGRLCCWCKGTSLPFPRSGCFLQLCIQGVNKKLVIPPSQCGILTRSQQQREGGEAGISPLQEAGQRECSFLALFLAWGGFGSFPA